MPDSRRRSRLLRLGATLGPTATAWSAVHKVKTVMFVDWSSTGPAHPCAVAEFQTLADTAAAKLLVGLDRPTTERDS